MKATRHRRVRLAEALASVRGRVDRQEGVVRGVKVLGLTSPNGKGGRRYLREALVKAARDGLYEGAKVKINHHRKAGGLASAERDVEDTFGWLSNVRVEADGLYADLNVLNPRSELAESVFTAAEKAPHLFGLSHHADGDVSETPEGEVVREILEVYSVDLVDSPATVGGLFESRRKGAVKVKLREWLEWAARGVSRPRRRRAQIKKLLEMDVMDGEMDVEAPPPADGAPPEDPTAALKSGFRAACMAVLDGDGNAADKVKRLKELLTTAERLMASGEEVAEEEDEELEEECDDDEDMRESRRRLKARERSYELLEEAGVVPDRDLVEALVGLRDDQARRRLIEREKRGAAPPSAPRVQPRSGALPPGKGTTTNPADELAAFIHSARG